MGHMRHGDQPALRGLPDKGVAIGQGAAKGSGRQAIQRRGDAGEERRVALGIIVFCHANPLFSHGCKGGLGRYSPRPAAPESSRNMNMNDPMFQTLTLALPMIAIFYFLLWRPQSQRQKQLRSMIDNVRRGDTVVTAGGILGRVVKAAGADDAEILVEIADNVQVRVLKSTISDVRAKGKPEKAEKE
jgi:preprotein translocase subunit YajC